MPSKPKNNPKLQSEKLQLKLINLLSREWLNQKDTQYLKELVDLNPLDRGGNPVILILCSQLRWDCIKKIVDLGADLGTCDQAGTSIALSAATLGKLEIIQSIKPCFPLDIPNPEGMTMLMAAAHNGHMEIVEWLVNHGANINFKNIYANTAIIGLAGAEKWDAVKTLAALGADLNLQGQDNHTVGILAAACGRLDIVQLIKPGPALDIHLGLHNDYGITMLIAAANAESVEIVEWLGKHGANVNTVDQTGKFLLYTAALNNRLAIVQALVQSGADIGAKDEVGLTALNIAEQGEFYDILFFLEDFLNKDKTLAASLLTLTSLLRKEIWSQDDESSMRNLFKEDLNPNVLIGYYQIPAIVYALRRNNVKAAEILIELGAGTKCLSEVQRDNNMTLLHSLLSTPSACKPALMTDPFRKKLEKVLDFLFRQNVGLNVVSFSDVDVVALARSFRNVLFLEMLEKYKKKSALETKEDEVNTKCLTFARIKIIKDAGHILGFDRKVYDIVAGGYHSFEACYLFKKMLSNLTLSAVLNSKKWFQQHFVSQYSLINEALDLEMQWLKVNGSITHQDFIKHYNDKKPIFLPIAYVDPAHFFTVIVWNDIIIVCNRGVDKLEQCISVFKMLNVDDSKRITPENLQTLIPEVGILTSPEGVFETLGKWVDLANPMLTFKAKVQRHNTCSFANLKSSMKPLIFIMELLSHAKQEYSKFGSDFLAPYLVGKPKHNIFQIIMRLSEQAYKELSAGIRDQQIKELCTSYQVLPVDCEDRKLYVELFKAIITKYYTKTNPMAEEKPKKEKIDSERARMGKLLEIMPEGDKKLILQWMGTNACVSNDVANLGWLRTLSLNSNAKKTEGQVNTTKFHFER
jgi:ankyrin repeat protein